MKIYKTETKEKGIVQITTLDERWYEKDGVYLPSVTWICSFYPKGIAYMKWLASKGWNEAEAIKTEAGDRGSRVHRAIERLLEGEKIKIDEEFRNSDGMQSELTPEEWESLMNFVAWFKENEVKVIRCEFPIFSEKYNFAGTIDLYCEIKGMKWLIDFKTSQTIWPSHELQVSAYTRAMEDQGVEVDCTGILQVGYTKNKAGIKLTEVSSKFDLFEATQAIWRAENEGVSPKQREYPESLSLK